MDWVIEHWQEIAIMIGLVLLATYVFLCMKAYRRDPIKGVKSAVRCSFANPTKIVDLKASEGANLPKQKNRTEPFPL